MIPATDSKNYPDQAISLEQQTVCVDFVPFSELNTIVDEWQELLRHAIEPNPCFAPRFALHFFKLNNKDPNHGVLTVRLSDTGTPGQLVGLLPIDQNRSFMNGFFHFIRAQYTPFSASTSPLIYRGFERPVCTALLDEIDQRTDGRGIVMFNEFRIDGPVGRHLFALLRKRGQKWSIRDQLERPIIDINAASSFAEYTKKLKGSTRQTIKRKWRQLEKLGDLSVTVHTDKQLQQAMQEFLELEAKGWKGRAGTAMILQPETRALAMSALCNESAIETRIESLRLNDKPIAMTIHIGAGDSAIHFKPTYDEAYAKYSPGLLLHYKTIQGMFEEGWALSLDAAVAKDSKLGSIWRERRQIGQVIFVASPKTSAVLLNLSNWWLSAFKTTKSAMQRFKARIVGNTQTALHRRRRNFSSEAGARR